MKDGLGEDGGFLTFQEPPARSEFLAAIAKGKKAAILPFNNPS